MARIWRSAFVFNIYICAFIYFCLFVIYLFIIIILTIIIHAHIYLYMYMCIHIYTYTYICIVSIGGCRSEWMDDIHQQFGRLQAEVNGSTRCGHATARPLIHLLIEVCIHGDLFTLLERWRLLRPRTASLRLRGPSVYETMLVPFVHCSIFARAHGHPWSFSLIMSVVSRRFNQ